MTDDSSSSVCLSLSSSSSSSLSSKEKPDAISLWKAILIPVSEHKCCYDSKENDEKDPVGLGGRKKSCEVKQVKSSNECWFDLNKITSQLELELCVKFKLPYVVKWSLSVCY